MSEISNVTRDDAITFLECACRNWRHVPKLSDDDLADVAAELSRFAKRRAEARQAPEEVSIDRHAYRVAHIDPPATPAPLPAGAVTEGVMDQAIDAYHAKAGKTADWDGVQAAIEAAFAARPAVTAPAPGLVEARRWLDEYIEELRKSPNRFADDIWGLEQVQAVLSSITETGGTK